jgi:hypothetical protein
LPLQLPKTLNGPLEAKNTLCKSKAKKLFGPAWLTLFKFRLVSCDFTSFETPATPGGAWIVEMKYFL